MLTCVRHLDSWCICTAEFPPVRHMTGKEEREGQWVEKWVGQWERQWVGQ